MAGADEVGVEWGGAGVGSPDGEGFVDCSEKGEAPKGKHGDKLY